MAAGLANTQIIARVEELLQPLLEAQGLEVVDADAGALREAARPAVTTPKRVGVMPDLPAVAEELPGFEVVGWYGVIGPAKLPRPLLMKLHGELVKIINLPDTRQRILADVSEPKTNTPEEFRRFMLADVEKWTKVVKASGARMN